MKQAERASRDISRLVVEKNSQAVPGSAENPTTVVLSGSSALSEAVHRSLGLPTPVVALQFQDDRVLSQLSDRQVGLVIIAEFHLAEAISKISFAKRRWRDCRVLVVGLRSSEDAVLQCVAAGADGVVSHDESFSQLREAVDTVLDNALRLPAPLVRPLLGRLLRLDSKVDSVGAKSRLRQLSPRQAEILSCLVDGLSNKDIALRLNLEVQTVKNYVNNILRKFGVRTRFDAARLSGSSSSKGS